MNAVALKLFEHFKEIDTIKFLNTENLQQLCCSLIETLGTLTSQEELDNFVMLIDHTLDTGAWK